MADTRQIFACNLNRLIDSRGIEQQQLAHDLQVSTSTVSAWVLGQRFPRADVMKKIADYFHISVSELVEDQSQAQTFAGDRDYREQLRRQPGMRTLLDATKDATDEEIAQYISIIKALRRPQDDD